MAISSAGLGVVILAAVPLASHPGQSVQSYMLRQKLEQQPIACCYIKCSIYG